MPFRFALQSVLHFRRSIEHQQELKLRTANQYVARTQHFIEQIEARQNQLHAARNQGLSAGLTAAELRFQLQCESQLLKHRRELEAQLIRLQQLRDQQREIFRLARQARETLEGVRNHQLQLFNQEAARREQKNLDDLFLMRLIMRRG
jgi:flagellar export protein FliJ